MEEQNYVTALREIEGRSLRDIAAHTGYHFNTDKKYADKEDWNMAYKPRKQRTSGLDPLKPTIDEWIREDLKRKRKHRRTATKIYNDLVANETLSQIMYKVAALSVAWLQHMILVLLMICAVF